MGWVTRRQGWLFFPLLLLEGINLHVTSIRSLFERRAIPGRALELTTIGLRIALYVAVVFWVLPLGMAFGLLHAFFTVGLALSQHVSGLGITMLATALSYYGYRVSFPKVTTPPTDAGILEGITRDAVIELARKANYEVREASLTRHDVYIADECFLTGSAAEVIPVVKVDRRKIGAGVPGPVTRDLIERFRRLTRG